MFRRTMILAALCCGFASAQAEAPTRAAEATAFARACLELRCPSVDDPDGAAAAALQALDGFRSRSYAGEVVQLLQAQRDELQRPADLLPACEALLQQSDLHGMLRSQLRWYHNRLLHAAGRIDALQAADPMAGRPRQFLCVGPFGEGEDHFEDVAFAPEFGPWPADARFVGAAVEPRTIGPGVLTSEIDPVDPGSGRNGCYYALHRVEADAPTQCYAAIWTQGAFELFVNGQHIATGDGNDGDGRNDWCVPIGLAAGTNHVVIKTCRSQRAKFTFDYVDARWRTLDALREVAADAPLEAAPEPVAATLPPYVDRYQELIADGRGAADADAALLQVTRGFVANSMSLREEQVREAEQLEVTADAAVGLGAAQLWRRLEQMPEQQRNARARAFVEAVAKELVDEEGHTEHFAMLRARVRLLEEQDQREDALRELWRAVETERAGPATFRLLLAVAKRAEFGQERPRVLAAWQAALPDDWLVSMELARDCYERDAVEPAAEHGARAVRLRPDQGAALSHAFRPMLDLGRNEELRELCDLVMPAETRGPDGELTPRLWQLSIAQREADPARWLALVEEQIADPRASASRLVPLADELLARGFDERAAACYEAALSRDPDEFTALRSLRRSLGAPQPGADLQRFRHDGDEAIAALKASERTFDAPATTLIDQRLVEVLPDGSQVVEVHELRRLNDPEGVQMYGAPEGLDEASEVLLLRTVDADGAEYVPVKVQGNYAMPRLEPGVFVEWRYRQLVSAATDGVVRQEPFLFGSMQDELVLSEFVLVQPDRIDGVEVRTRGFDEPSETTTLEGERTARTWRRRDVARVQGEALLPPLAFLVPVVEVGADTSMDDVLRERADNVETMSQPTPAIRDRVATLLADVDDDDGEARLRALYDWCQQEIAPGRSRSATEALLTRQGNRVQLLLAMLRTAGFELESAMGESILPEMFDGYTSLFEFAAYRFDAWCVRVSGHGIEPAWLFFDAARYEPLRWIHPQRAGGEVLVWTARGTELTRFPSTDEHVQHLVVSGTGKIDAEAVTLDARIELRGGNTFQAAEHFLRQPKSAARQFARQFAQQILRGWQVSAADVVDLEPGRCVTVAVQATRRSIQQSGQGALLPLPIVAARLRAGLAPLPKRKTPMRITTDLHFGWDLEFELDGVQPVELPEPVTFSRGPCAFVQSVRMRDGKLVLRRRATVTPATIAPERLGDWARTLESVEQQEQLTIPCLVR